MTRLQRFLLFLFAGLICFKSDSSYETLTEVYLRLFFLGILIILAISPKCWFIKQPTPILSSSEGLSVFIALFKIRSAEIASSYSTIREYQDKPSKESNWIALLMKDFSTISNDPLTERITEKKKRRLEKRADEKFYDYYKFISCAPLDLDRKRIKDIKIALTWNLEPVFLVKKLKSLKEFGIIHSQIDRLITLYNRLGTKSFSAIFINDFQKFFNRITFDQIHLIWEQILEGLKTRIMLEKIKNMRQENKSELDQLLKEIEALIDLDFWIDYTISTNKRHGTDSPSEENEKLLLAQLSQNPILK